MHAASYPKCGWPARRRAAWRIRAACGPRTQAGVSLRSVGAFLPPGRP
ncbi:hypothetical protein ACFOEY_03550 [Paracandidimonas soli]